MQDSKPEGNNMAPNDAPDEQATAEYAAAWGDDGAKGADNFGAVPDEVAAAVEPVEPVAPSADGGKTTEDQPITADAEVQQVAPSGPAETEPEMQTGVAPEAGQVDPEKEAQRLRSWEGRLKKLEADLKAKSGSTEQATAEALEEVAVQGEGTPSQDGQPSLSQEANELAEMVEDGSMSADEAINQLTEDFGETFVKMIESIVAKKAAEIGGKVATEQLSRLGQDVEDIVAHLSDANERAHFEKIMSAVPDYGDIVANEEFREFANADPERAKIASGGNANQVIALLNEYKAQAGGQDEPELNPADHEIEPEDPAIAAAEGVRSGGMRLPEEPKVAQDDYEGAWNAAAKG